MLRNTKTMLFLLAIISLLLVACDPDVTITVEGDVEDWSVTGLDTHIEKVAEPILDFGDSVVEFARDTEKEFIGGIYDPNDLSMEGFFGTD